MNKHFLKFRNGIIGIDTDLLSPDKETRKLIYADWAASGRNYLPIESRIQEEIMPLVANTHTDTSTSGMAMTHAYHTAQGVIKDHVNADSEDLILTGCSGMTGLINKFQRMLGFRANGELDQLLPEEECPVVFLTHMEHHSNHTSWLETIATVEIIQPTAEGLVDLNSLKDLLQEYKDRPLIIASISACSNVTGISTPIHQIAQLMHEAGGYCFVDFACSAPYVEMDMHPEMEGADLDAIFFSPHKFLGGPGSTGVLIFNRDLYQRDIPDNPGGGTVDWTNPWGGHKYIDDIEAREDGGTPAFLQTIKAAMCITLKDEMGVPNILAREHHLLELFWEKITKIPNLTILAPQHRDRLPVVSFYIEDLHYNLGVKLLNDKFGIQCRGGCSCAGTYGHYLLNIDQSQSKHIAALIDQGDLTEKPGWIRVSLHPTMTDEEVMYIGESIKELAENHQEWRDEYLFDPSCTDLKPREFNPDIELKEKITRAITKNFLP